MKKNKPVDINNINVPVVSRITDGSWKSPFTDGSWKNDFHIGENINKSEQKKLVHEIADYEIDKIIRAIDEGKILETWGGFELRLLLIRRLTTFIGNEDEERLKVFEKEATKMGYQ